MAWINTLCVRTVIRGFTADDGVTPVPYRMPEAVLFVNGQERMHWQNLATDVHYPVYDKVTSLSLLMGALDRPHARQGFMVLGLPPRQDATAETTTYFVQVQGPAISFALLQEEAE